MGGLVYYLGRYELCLDGSRRCEREKVAKRILKVEGDGAFPHEPVHGGKDLGLGIHGQQGSKFTQRACAD